MSIYLTSVNSEFNQLGMLFIGLLSGLIISFIIFSIFYKRRKQSSSQQAVNVKSKMDVEDVSMEVIFEELDLGVLVFGTDRRLTLANHAAETLLGTSDLPKSLEDFLTKYGEENGLKARFILSKGPTSAQWHDSDRVLRIVIKQSRVDSPQNSGHIVLLQDITDQELQEKQRKEFVANVSHELKTPLTTITTYSESLLDWGLDEKQKDGVRKDLMRIHDDAIRMEGLVADLLLLSSIDSRKLQNRMEPLDFSFLIKQTVDRMLVQAKEKQQRLSFMEMSKLPVVFGDRSSLERVVSNLISNSIKYTDPKGSIKVYVGRVLDSVYVKVTDTGHGIEEKHIGQIFNRFYRVDMTGSRMYGGTGLGLAIAQELVSMHMGQISVQSALGQGSSFTVMIPLASKVYCDTLTDVLSNVTLHSELRIAAAKELVSQLNERGESIDSLRDLSDEQLQKLIARFANEGDEKAQTENQEKPVKIERSSNTAVVKKVNRPLATTERK